MERERGNPTTNRTELYNQLTDMAQKTETKWIRKKNRIAKNKQLPAKLKNGVKWLLFSPFSQSAACPSFSLYFFSLLPLNEEEVAELLKYKKINTVWNTWHFIIVICSCFRCYLPLFLKSCKFIRVPAADHVSENHVNTFTWRNKIPL